MQLNTTQTRLPMTKDGFPILPTPWKGSQYKKKELNEWFMLYVGQHYSMITSYSTYLHAELANNGRSCHIPFKAIADQTSLLINPEYLPASLKFRDPQNMHKSVIEDFFDHVLQWQTVQGPERAFRFTGIKARDGSVSLTHYPNVLNNPKHFRHISKWTGQRNANDMPDAISITGTQPHPTAKLRLRLKPKPKPKLDLLVTHLPNQEAKSCEQQNEG